MSESLKLFKDIANYKCFVENDTAIILFLNKYDLFEKKIAKVPLNIYWKDYTGLDEPEEASDYIRERFLELAPQGKNIYTYKTTATDTENIKKVFRAVKDIIVSAYLKTMGLLDYAVPVVEVQQKPNNNASPKPASAPPKKKKNQKKTRDTSDSE